MSKRPLQFNLVAANEWSRLPEGRSLKRQEYKIHSFALADKVPSTAPKPAEDTEMPFVDPEREHIEVSGHDFGRFIDAISASAAPSPAHLALVRRRRRSGR